MPRWTSKPPLGALLDRTHPLTSHLVLACLMREGTGMVVGDVVGNHPGAANNGTYTAQWGTRSLAGSTIGFDIVDTTRRVNFGSANFIPSSNLSAVFRYKKRDATLRSSACFGCTEGTDLTTRFGCHLPFSDGIAYFDCGGASSGTTRLSVAGLTFGDDIWCLCSGTRGLEIWQNGILQASNSSNPTNFASSGGGSFQLGQHAGIGNDLADFGFFYLFNTQLSASDIRGLTADPNAFVAKSSSTRFVLASATSSSVGSGGRPIGLGMGLGL